MWYGFGPLWDCGKDCEWDKKKRKEKERERAMKWRIEEAIIRVVIVGVVIVGHVVILVLVFGE